MNDSRLTVKDAYFFEMISKEFKILATSFNSSITFGVRLLKFISNRCR